MNDYNIELVCTVTDPAERRQRLARAYDILLGAANRAQQHPGSRHDETIETLPLVDDNAPGSEH